jgi:hypothetical protein
MFWVRVTPSSSWSSEYEQYVEGWFIHSITTS